MEFMRFTSRTSYACRIVFNIYITNWYVLSLAHYLPFG